MIQTLTQTMKAMAIDQFGSSAELHVVELARPEPKPYEVLIQVAYAGVNPVDYKVCEGKLKERLPHQMPLIPGWDVSGKVVAVGSDVHHLKVGDAVMAYCRKPIVQWGTYAEYVAFNALHIAKKPQGISYAQAASIPLAALTAWQALFNFGHMHEGQNVFIQAGAGGVGGFAVQFAKYARAHTFSTARAENHGYLRELGVEHPIDYTTHDVVAEIHKVAPQGVDIAFEMIGGPAMETSIRTLRPGGFLATILQPLDFKAMAAADVYGEYVFVRPDGWQLQTIADLINHGKIKAPRLEILPLDRAVEAHEKISSGHTVGKIVLKVAGDL